MERLKKIRRLIALLLTVVISCSVIPIQSVNAESMETEEPSVIARGYCGDQITWEITADYKLILSGEGDMYDYYLGTLPWRTYASDIQEVVIGEQIRYIGRYAFAYFTALKELYIPDSVEGTGQAILMSTAALEKLRVPFVGQVAGETGDKCGSQYMFGVWFSSQEFKGGVKCNQVYSAYESEVYIPATLKSVEIRSATIPNYTFNHCNTLEEVTFTGNITKIPLKAFRGCANLKQITIPKSVSIVDYQAFEGCTSLETIRVLSNFECGENAFDKNYVKMVEVSCEVYDQYYDDDTARWIKKDFVKWIGSSVILCKKYHPEVKNNRCLCCGEHADGTEHQYEENPASEFLVSEATCTNKAVYAKSCRHCYKKSDTETFEYGEYVAHCDADRNGKCDICGAQLQCAITAIAVKRGEEGNFGVELLQEEIESDRDEQIKFTAPSVPGYHFVGWFALEDVDYKLNLSDTHTYTVNLNQECHIVALYEPNEKVKIVINGFGFKVTIGDEEISTQYGIFIEYVSVGKQISLCAVDENFINWQNVNQRILTREKEYSFTVTGETHITMGIKNPNPDIALVEFLSDYGQSFRAELAPQQMKLVSRLDLPRLDMILSAGVCQRKKSRK